MNLNEKILDIMKAVQYLAKDDQVAFGNTKYRALSEEKVTTIMRQQLIEHGLIVYPAAMAASRAGQISHVDVTYRMVDTESGEYIEIASCGDGADSQDKGAGKAMTYAYKYMWLRAFALPTGEDPDKISSAELDAKATKAAEKIRPSTEEAKARMDAKSACQKVVKAYCKDVGADENEGWKSLATAIGKASKDFTAEDWHRAEEMAKRWGQ